jgi:uncharacterized protein (DUF488 family)
MKTIWTVGHSTHSLEEFIKILKSFDIDVLVDIRTHPGSRKFPHFNKEQLSESLKQCGIVYEHLPALGGRRKPKKDSANTVWKNLSFRGYADYMETEEFASGIQRLTDLAQQSRVAYMCSEAVWWRCHRALVSDYLKKKGWQVCHILKESKSEEHPFTAPARAGQGSLFQ